MPSDAVVMTAIIAVAALEVVALCFGYDGAILAGAMAIIGGLGGYTVRVLAERRAHERKGV